MRVLIADGDLWRAVGGGQAIYRALVTRSPAVEFTYLRRDEPAGAPRPPNAHPVAVSDVVPRALMAWLRRADALARAGVSAQALDAWAEAQRLAAAVEGREFDVVEVPDYLQMGAFLLPAFARRSVRVGRLVVSLHGRQSRSVALGWRPDPLALAALDSLERLQLRCADLRYGFGGPYVEEMRALTGLPTVLVDPLPLLARPVPSRTVPSAAPPDLQFVGRLDRIKGPDLFVELVSRLPRDAYRTARLVGPDVELADGTTARAHLADLIRARGADVQLEPGVPPEQVASLFAQRAVTVLPSRADTLNLVALESLFSGCPTAIAEDAGVCQLLRSAMAHVPFVALDLAQPRRAAEQVVELLRDYDARREALVQALEGTKHPAGPFSLEQVYGRPIGHDPAARVEAARLDAVLHDLVGGESAGAQHLLRATEALARPFAALLGPRGRRAVKTRARRAWVQVTRTARSDPAEPSKLAIFDPRMGHQPGHFLEYSPRVLAAAKSRGLDAVILAHRDLTPDLDETAIPHFRTHLYERLPRRPLVTRDVVRFTLTPFELARDHVRAIAAHDLDHALVFVHTCHADDLFAWALTAAAPRARRLRLALVFHDNLRCGADGATARARLLDLRLLAGLRAVRALYGERARFYTDSAGLTATYQRFTGFEFRTLPVPVDFGELVAPPAGRGPRVRLAYAGDAREEKGFLLVPALARAVAAGELGPSVDLAVQANLPFAGGEPRCVAAREELQALASGGRVSLLPDRALTRDEYLAHLVAADIVVLPYDPALYRDRTSGIMAEAFALGRVCVAPAGCWAGEQVTTSGAGTLMERFDGPALVAAARRAVDSLEACAARAQEASAGWRQRTRSDELISALLEGARCR